MTVWQTQFLSFYCGFCSRARVGLRCFASPWAQDGGCGGGIRIPTETPDDTSIF